MKIICQIGQVILDKIEFEKFADWWIQNDDL